MDLTNFDWGQMTHERHETLRVRLRLRSCQATKLKGEIINTFDLIVKLCFSSVLELISVQTNTPANTFIPEQ